MRLVVVLAFVLAGSLAQKPEPCKSPPLMSGALTVSTLKEQLWVYTKYLYDAQGQRLRLTEFMSSVNKTFTYDILYLFKEQVVYQILDSNSSCTVSPLTADFVPMDIPDGASMLAQNLLGSLSGPGLLVNTWGGVLPHVGGTYMFTMTEIGCFPVSFAVQTNEHGWMLFSYFNNSIEISDPGVLNPPSFCPGSGEAADGEPVDFLGAMGLGNERAS